MKETDLFEPIKKWLEDGGNEVYSEVRAKRTFRRADVVGVHGGILTVVEMKTGISLDLIEQAVGWRNRAHYIYVAIPKPKTHLNEFARKLLQQHGIGILTVNLGDDAQSVSLYRNHKPKLNRRIVNDLSEALTEYHKNALPGGSSGGGYVTTYSLTMMRIKEYLENELQTRRTRDREGWRTTNEILDDVTTHWSSPKPSLAHALREFEQDWCEWRKQGGKLEFRFRNPP